ncbi:hypothetical protein D3C87_460180 [compost metagenome]
MILHFSSFLQEINLPVILNFLISLGLGFSGFFFAFVIKKKEIKGRWFTSLRYILAIMSVAAMSNAYSIVILGYRTVQPSELLLNISMLILMAWATAYYIVNIMGPGTSLTEEKVLKFIENEHQTTSNN